MGEFLLGSRALKEHKGRLLEQASEIAEQGGGLLIIAYAEEYEQTIQLLLSLLMGQLRYERKPAQLFLPQLESIPDYELLSNPFLLVHNLPQCQGLIELLDGRRGKLPVIIATGMWSSPARLPPQTSPSRGSPCRRRNELSRIPGPPSRDQRCAGRS